jgi:putative ABC transport system permease protein
VLDSLGVLIGGTLAVGLLVGALSSLYAAVSARSRSLSYVPSASAQRRYSSSVLCDALLLALASAVAGAAIAWLFFGGRLTSMFAMNGEMSQAAFTMEVTPALIALGILWGCFIGLAGRLLPAIRAARLPVARALNAER